MSAIVEVKDVGMYFGGLKAVDHVSLRVEKGEIFGIIGPNGAGKTTLFNVCSGFYKPTYGEVYLDGEKISGLTPDKIAQKGMSRTFQNIQLFKYMTVHENVKAGFHIRTKTGMINAILHDKTFREDEKLVNEKAMEILEEVGLAGYVNTMAANLPYGIQRKVEIARALAVDPKVIFLDEPAAGMNPNETQDLMEHVKMLNKKGYSIVVIEHDMKFVMNCCTRIHVLNFGQTIFEGTPEEVSKDAGVLEAYFGKNVRALS